MGKVPAIVLTTVNAPHSKKLSAAALAHCLKDHMAALEAPGHMSAFFGDVSAAHQIAFAAAFGISDDQLASAAQQFAAYSGESYQLAE